MLNIEQVRKNENVTLVDMADAINKNYRTVREKIDNDNFTTAEAFIIYNTFFKNKGYDFTFLFSKEQNSA